MEWIVEADSIKDVVTGHKVTFKRLIRCKDCKHRPVKKDPGGPNYGFNLMSATEAEMCPCIVGDNWYSWTPRDDFFCGNGERKDDANND